MNEEISLYEVLQIFLSKWRILLILALLCILAAIFKHKKMPSYPAKGTLLIKTSENSQLRSFLKSIVGDQQKVDPAERSMILLETNNFFLAFAEDLLNKKFKNKEFSKFLNSFNNNQQSLASFLRSKLRLRLKKGGQILFSAKTNRRVISVNIVNEGLKVSKIYLTNNELKEYNEAENYFQKQIDHTLNNLSDLTNRSLIKMKKGNILSINGEKGEGIKYLGSLKKQINDSRIKIAENQQTIRKLRTKIKKNRNNVNRSKFGARARIRQYLDENSTLYVKIKTNKRYLNKISSKKLKLVPYQQEMERLKANYHFEFKIYEGLRDKLSKIGLQKTYIKNKIMVLEFERLKRVKSRPGLFMLILIGIMVSQVIGFISIYLIELFKPVPIET